MELFLIHLCSVKIVGFFCYLINYIVIQSTKSYLQFNVQPDILCSLHSF